MGSGLVGGSGGGVCSGGSAEVDVGDAGGGDAQGGAGGVGEAEISTARWCSSTGRVSHAHYIAFARYLRFSSVGDRGGSRHGLKMCRRPAVPGTKWESPALVMLTCFLG